MKRIASYRDTLVDALRYWPTLYLNEDDVLLNLFFHIGTGYEWKNGCITFDIGAEQEMCPLREDPHAERLKDREWREDCVNRPFTKYSRSRCWFRTKTGGIGHNLTEMFGEYSNILQLPDNIQPDWLVAAKRALNMARSYRVRTTKAQKELLRQVAFRIKELQDAKKRQVRQTERPHALVQGNVRRAGKADVLHAAGDTG
jgi:hypothetical protein